MQEISRHRTTTPTTMLVVVVVVEDLVPMVIVVVVVEDIIVKYAGVPVVMKTTCQDVSTAGSAVAMVIESPTVLMLESNRVRETGDGCI